MALDNVLKIYDEQGNPVDYDILASDVKFNDGKDLPTKLDELEQEIGEGGYEPPQGGIPKTDLSSDVQTSLGKADTAYQKPSSGIPASDIADGVIPDVSGLATKTELQQGLADKVDKVTGYGLSKNDYTDADKTKLAGIAAGAEVNVIDGIIVGNTEVQPVNKKVTIPAGADGITPQIGSNGNWWIGATDTGIHAQGPAGTSITDADLVIGNALNGQGDVLGMSGAMQMKNNLDFVYSKLQALFAALGNIAFWDGKPANLLPQSLDWSVPKITVTLDLSSVDSHITVLHGSTPVSDRDTVQVDEGSDLVLTIVPNTDYALTSVSSTTSGVAVSQDLSTVTLANVTAAITLDIIASVMATSPYEVPSGGELLFWLDGLDVKSGDTQWIEKLNEGTADQTSYSIVGTGVSPDETHHCWSFNNPGINGGFMSAGKKLTFDPTQCTIEVVYKPVNFHASDSSNNRFAVVYFDAQNGTTISSIHLVARQEGSNGWLDGVYVSGSPVTNDVWAHNNVANQAQVVGMNEDVAVSNGIQLSALGTNHWSGARANSSVGGCINHNGGSYGQADGNIYAVRVYRGKLTAAQMLANQKIDNERYGLGITLPNSVQ